MSMTMIEQYNKIISDLKKARSENDTRKVKNLSSKLERWQRGYGAYAPITQGNFHRYE